MSHYGAILIDPPWQYNLVAGKTAKRWGTADAHYSLMTRDELEAMPIRDLAAKNCALFMWATMPVLPQAIALGSAWGFTYKTCAFTWVKNNRGGFGFYMGLGMWTRANAELCLLFTRGAPKRKAADVRQVIMAPVRQHSRKPDEQYERIERLVDGPYIEVFARRARVGWDAIGNEIDGRDVREVLEERARWTPTTTGSRRT